MLPQGSFSSTNQNGVITLVPRTAEAKAAIQQLAVRTHGVLIQMQQAGLEIPSAQFPADGSVGPSLALSVQTVLLAIARVIPPPQHLAGILSEPATAIMTTGIYADEILAFIDAALMQQPSLFTTGAQPPSQDPAAMEHPAGKFLTMGNMAAIGTGVVVLGGIALLAYSADRRLGGRVDRTGLLDPVDDADDGDEYEYEDDGPQPAPDGVIDAESTEVSSE